MATEATLAYRDPGYTTNKWGIPENKTIEINGEPRVVVKEGSWVFEPQDGEHVQRYPKPRDKDELVKAIYLANGVTRIFHLRPEARGISLRIAQLTESFYQTSFGQWWERWIG